MKAHRKLTAGISTIVLAGLAQATIAAPATLGNAFNSATRTNNNGTSPLSIIVDGSTGSWATAEGNDAYTLDAGHPQQMQGVYLWLPHSLSTSYWMKVETSADGQSWHTQWRAISTKRNHPDKPLYLPFPKTSQSIRFVKVSEAGNISGVTSGMIEARWLATSQAVSRDLGIPKAHWLAPSPSNRGAFGSTNITHAKPMNTPNLVSWSLAPSNYLSKAALHEAELEEGNCPKIGASVFYPETLVVSATGEMPSFKTSKSMPDGTQVVVLDWSHVDLTHDYGGRQAGFSGGYPTEQGTLRQGRDVRSSTEPHQDFIGNWYFCDGGAGDAHYGRGDLYQNYWDYTQDGSSYANEINGGWDDAIPNPAVTYTSAISLGFPFARVFGDEGKFGSDEANTVDGFVDIGSRWSDNEDGNLTFVSGPSLTAAPPIRGLYIWMHRSNHRRSTISITARADTEEERTVLPPTLLPMTSTKEQPVFVPIQAGNTHFKHITITGHGNDGGGNSSNVWSSIAEVRYASSSTAPAGIPTVATLSCIPFTLAHGSTATGAITTNSASITIDANTQSLNYWASNQPSQLILDTGSTNMVSQVKIWMHKSHIRTSEITLSTLNQPHQAPTTTQNVHLPRSPMNQAETIMLNAPTSTRFIELGFNGNSQSSWNSISEVCWQ